MLNPFSHPLPERRRRMAAWLTTVAVFVGLQGATLAQDLAQGKTATASSIENASYPAASAFDGNSGSRWSSQRTDPQWIQVDLGSTVTINRVYLNWEAASAKSYSIEVSNDAANWSTIASKADMAAGARVDDLSGLSGSGRYVRMYGTSRTTPYGYSLFDLKVYGSTPVNAISLPGKVQAEEYRADGEGVGYHDLTGGNTGGAMRQDNVDIEACSDIGGGYNVGWIEAGEWLSYDVKVTQSGTYKLVARVASQQPGTKTLTASVDGVTVATFSFTAANGWQSYSDVVANNVNLTAGNHVLRLNAVSGGFNLNYLDVAAIGNQRPVANTGPDQSVTVGTKVTLDGRGSSDPDNGPQALYYSWSQLSGPTIFLTGDNTAQPSFTPSEAGTYTFSLLVYDGAAWSSGSDEVTITVSGAQFTLTTAVSGQGSISPDAGSFASGTQVVLTATPASGWSFSHWEGDVGGGSNPVRLAMSDNRTARAVFTQNPNFLIIVSSPLYHTGTIATDLATYQQDIRKEGWISEIITVNTQNDGYADFVCPKPQDLKNIILDYNRNGLQGFVIVGSPNDIPTAYWRAHEREANPDYNQDPTDMFYADMNEWRDLDGNGIYESYYSKYSAVEKKDVPDFTKPANEYNQDPKPDLMYGRISLNASVTSLDEQASKISAYFAKIHDYRLQGSQLTEEQLARSLYMINDCYSAGMNSDINVLTASPNIDVLAGYTLLFPEKLKQQLSSGYRFAQIITHSGSKAHMIHSWADERKTFPDFTLADLRSTTPRIHCIALFGCYAGKFDVPNFGETYLYENDYTHNVMASTGGWGVWLDTLAFRQLSDGNPVGLVFRDYMTRADYGRPKGILHGDPLLTYAAPVTNKAPMFSTRFIGHEATTGREFQLQINAVDLDGDAFAITLSDLPTGASFDGSTLSWTPAADQQGTTDTILATVTDQNGNTTNQAFTLYVSPIVNGMVESGEGWIQTGSGQLLPETIDPYYMPYGAPAQRLHTSTSWISLSQVVPVKPYTRYRLSYWAHNNLPQNPQAAFIRVDEFDLNIAAQFTETSDFRFNEGYFSTGNQTAVTISLNNGDAATPTSGDVCFSLLRLIDEKGIVPELNNGTFELGYGKTVNDWSTQLWQSSASVMSWEPDGRNNTHCAKIASSAQNDAAWLQYVAGLTPGKSYDVAGYIKGENVVTGNYGASLCIMETYATSHENQRLTGTFDWTPVQFTFTAPRSGAVTVGCRLGYYGSTATGTVWFDDITLTPVNP
jgi:hypothetical protein